MAWLLWKIKKNQQKTLSDLKSDYYKVAGYKDNIKNSAVFLYTSGKQLEFEMKKKKQTIYFNTKKWSAYIKNLTKHV